MILTLHRLRYTTSSTFGELVDEQGHHLCFTLERPWLDNQHDISCIPPGTYPVFRAVHHPNTPTAYPCWGLEHVPNRSAIEIHRANLSSELQGCIAVGTELGEAETEHGVQGYGIRHSKDALDLLDDHLQGASEWTLTILPPKAP